jgi:PEP-CTERM motif
VKFRPLLIVGASVLISAMPALANGIPYAGLEKDLSSAHLASFSEFKSFERSFFVPHTETAWDKKGEGSKGSDTAPGIGKSSLLLAVTPAVTPVPEPGSLSLVLIGLAATGFLALRRRKLPTAMQVGA